MKHSMIQSKEEIKKNPFWRDAKPPKGMDRFVVPTKKYWKFLERLLVDEKN